MYIIEYQKDAEKDLRKIDRSILPGIVKKINKLADNPYPNGSIKIVGSRNYYRIRHSDYRIIYAVNHGILTIYIIKVDHRSEVYRDF